MLERVRDALATGLTVLAQRVSREPRYVEHSRVSTSPRTLAGVLITPDTAITIPAVWACLTYISESVAVMPWRVMRSSDAGSELAPSHPVDRMLATRPNAEWSTFQLRETLVHWALRWGNGYAEIERDTVGRPFALWPIHPERVDVCRDPATGELFYEVRNDNNSAKVELASADMFHLRGFGEGPVGVNVMHYASQSLGWARAAQLFGASFFGNGAVPATVIKNKKALTPEGKKVQRAEFDQLYKGPRNAHKTAQLDNDADLTVLSVDPQKSQLVETQHFLIEEICRWFRVPPHIIAELSRSTNNNIEHQGIEAVQRCLAPWVKRLELEADYKLLGQNRFFTKMNMAALLRGDFKSQAEGFRVYREMGVINANEIREKLDMNKMAEGDGGDKFTMNGAYTTMERIGEEPVEVTPASPAEPSNDSAEDEAAAAASLSRINALLEHHVPAD